MGPNKTTGSGAEKSKVADGLWRISPKHQQSRFFLLNARTLASRALSSDDDMEV